ncbi:hypothetical protein Ddc_08444 [Ditylenchus destructor]|nr:hypothetical protein Ddc_08444 [Ditylenchus destructor]
MSSKKSAFGTPAGLPSDFSLPNKLIQPEYPTATSSLQSTYEDLEKYFMRFFGGSRDLQQTGFADLKPFRTLKTVGENILFI